MRQFLVGKVAFSVSGKGVWVPALAVALGVLKIGLHYFSVYRLGLLDYLVGLGAIFGGVFLFSKHPSKALLLVSGFFICVELYKAMVDYYDFLDVCLVILAIGYLIIPFLRIGGGQPSISRN